MALSADHFVQVASSFKGLPGQIAGLKQLHGAIAQSDPGLLADGAEWLHTFRSDPPAPPAAAIPGLDLVKSFEGCRLQSYNDGVGVATIGWGSTHWPDGRPVKLGESCSQEQADAMLEVHIRQSVLPALAAIPNWGGMSEQQRGALVSFAYNLGARFYGGADFATITACLRDHKWEQVPQALLLYVNPGSAVEEGLRRRRAAEGALWSKGLPHTATAGAGVHANPLAVPAFDQLLMDDGQGARDCFSASCAMLAAFAGAVADENTYNHRRQKHGDSTDAAAQLATLKELGLKPVYGQDGSKAKLIQMLDNGHPVAVGILHHGPASAPSGGGHWMTAIGYDADHILVNDPFGELANATGGYVRNHNGAGQRYSFKNWLPRWMPGGSGGWYLVLQ
jgi:GH24 family phage-related lysozyme (muramidase)